MPEIWNTLLLDPLVNGLIFLYNLTGNLGIAIIIFTILVRLILSPLALPAMRTAQKIKELAPQMAKLKVRHKGDRTKFSQAQMDLYRQHGINPAAGCLPQIIQIVILIALFQSFNTIFASGDNVVGKLNEFLWPSLDLAQDAHLNTRFLYLDLAKPDSLRIASLPIPLPGLLLAIAAIAQFVSSAMMLPAVKAEEKVAKKTPGQMDDLATSMQESMLWIFPISTIIIGIAFPSGLVLYWAALSIFQAAQQYMISGWGGVIPLTRKAKKFVGLSRI